MTTPSQDLRKCRRCLKLKPRSEFYLHSRARRLSAITAFGRKREMHCAHCKACDIKQTRAYYRKNRDRVLALDKKTKVQRWNRIKETVFLAYGGFRCACCGETEKLFLSLDHIANDGAEFRRNNLGDRRRAGYATYAWLYRNGFPEGIQVLCMNCQHGKRMNKGICPHQVRRNDYPQAGVGSSDPKRGAPQEGEDIASTAMKVAAVIN